MYATSSESTANRILGIFHKVVFIVFNTRMGKIHSRYNALHAVCVLSGAYNVLRLMMRKTSASVHNLLLNVPAVRYVRRSSGSDSREYHSSTLSRPLPDPASISAFADPDILAVRNRE